MKFRIKEVCKEKGTTITGLAGKLNMKQVSLSRIINGNPTIGTLKKIAAALDVSIIELFEANCPKCGMRFAADAVQSTQSPLPPSHEAQKGSILDFVEKHVEKNGGNLTALIKNLREYGGGDVLVSQVDDKFYNGFLEFLKTAKKQAQGKVITEQHQKRIKNDFDKILALLPDGKKF